MPTKAKCCGRCVHASGPFELAPKSIIGGTAYICTCAGSDACFDLVDAAYCCGCCEPQDEVQDEGDAH